MCIYSSESASSTATLGDPIFSTQKCSSIPGISCLGWVQLVRKRSLLCAAVVIMYSCTLCHKLCICLKSDCLGVKIRDIVIFKQFVFHLLWLDFDLRHFIVENGWVGQMYLGWWIWWSLHHGAPLRMHPRCTPKKACKPSQGRPSIGCLSPSPHIQDERGGNNTRTQNGILFTFWVSYFSLHGHLKSSFFKSASQPVAGPRSTLLRVHPGYAMDSTMEHNGASRAIA